MSVTHHSGVKTNLSFVNGVWQVVITAVNHTEHKSFSTESEAKAYLDARTEQLRQAKKVSPLNGAKP